ncbi:TetR/AcrR family transcriptional regulator [Loigolactobacillus coryniformis]|uniref:TetR/AcrR family transcriptional regulator n=1 Tax=Loigolactobacillus coryniformis TaxID=1610 RepID=UPI00345C7B68
MVAFLFYYPDKMIATNAKLVLTTFDQYRRFAYTADMRKKDEKKAEQIIASVTELILEVGLSGVTIAKIAQAADLYPSTIYIYFKDKEDLLRQVFRQQRRQLQQYLGEKLALVSAPNQQVQIYMRALFQFAQDQPRQLATLNQFLSSPLLDQLAIPTAEQNLIFPELKTVLQQGQAAGAFRPVPVTLAIALINSDVLQYAQAVQQHLVDPVVTPLDQLLALTATWLLPPKN